MRAAVHNIVKELALPKLYYINGRECLTMLSGLSSDGIHPSNSGMEEIAGRIYQRIPDEIRP